MTTEQVRPLPPPPARGIAYGLGLSVPTWLFLGLVLWWLVVHYSAPRRSASRLELPMRAGHEVRRWLHEHRPHGGHILG